MHSRAQKLIKRTEISLCERSHDFAQNSLTPDVFSMCRQKLKT